MKPTSHSLVSFLCFSFFLFINEINLCVIVTDYGGLEVDEDSPGHVFARSGFAEEGVETVIATADGLVWGHLTIRLDPMLETIKFPAGIADLYSSLADMHWDTFTLKKKKKKQIPNKVFTNFYSIYTYLLKKSMNISLFLIFYFSMKIQDCDHRGTLCIHFSFFRRFEK